MAKRRLRQAKKEYLISELGTACAIKGDDCVGDPGPDNVEFDHVDGNVRTFKGYRCGIVNESWRDLFYQVNMHLIQPACRHCNASKQ